MNGDELVEKKLIHHVIHNIFDDYGYYDILQRFGYLQHNERMLKIIQSILYKLGIMNVFECDGYNMTNY